MVPAGGMRAALSRGEARSPRAWLRHGSRIGAVRVCAAAQDGLEHEQPVHR